VSITTHTGEGQVQQFSTTMNFAEYDLPAGTIIYLEAYYRNALMRFRVGVLSPEHSEYQHSGALSELQDPQVNFRVKIVDESQDIGRIVAVVDRIQVFNQDSKQVTRVGLLPVKFEDLGEQIWLLELSDDNSDPVLCVNKALDTGNVPINEIVRYPMFTTLVYPQVVRDLLRHLFFDKQGDYGEEDPDGWGYKWVRFAESLPGAGRHPESGEDEETREWIEQVVQGFCLQNRVKNAFEKYIGEGQA
jgi:hypothetical protein